MIGLLGLALLAAPALAGKTHVFKSAVGGGELTAPAGLAVDDTSGDLYVADTAQRAIVRFDAAGDPAPFAFSGGNAIGLFSLPTGTAQVAVDNGAGTGRFYVIDGATLRAYESSGAPAAFSASVSYVSGNAITGTPAEPFSGSVLTAVAVDTEGDIYLTDSADSMTHVYAPSGEALASFGLFPTRTIGIDPNGLAYAGNPEFGLVETATPSAYPPTASTTYQSEFSSLPPGPALAVDPADGRIYTSQGSSTEEPSAISEFGNAAEANAPLVEFGSEQLTKGAAGIAVDRAGAGNEGDVYVSTAGQVDRFGPLVTVPDVVTEPPTAVDSTAKSATLNGTVNPDGVETTECRFEYGLTTSYGQTVPCRESSTQIGEGEDPVPVEADISGLADGDYHFRLSAANADGGAKGGDQTFSIVNPPVVAGESAGPGATEAQLTARIDPGNLQTTYSFEYGTTAGYGSTTQLATLAKGTAVVAATLGVVGLSPQTTYHFRVVATNAAGTVRGDDATFTTEAAASGSCPNEALRIGPSALLPECRAYEMVSPVDKNGGAVFPSDNDLSSESGDAAEFLSTTAFAGAPAGALNAYISRRGPNGWETTGIDAPQDTPGIIELVSPGTSETFGRSFQVSMRALTPGAVDGDSNLYMRDNATGVRSLIATDPGSALFNEYGNGSLHLVYGSRDWSVFFFTSDQKLTPDAADGELNTYEYTGGALSLVTVPGEPGDPAQRAELQGVSRDGSRLLLIGLANHALYEKHGSEEAELISGSHRAGEAGQAAPVIEGKATPDGSVVFFISETPLTEDANPAGGRTLYRYDVGSGTLEDLTPIEAADVYLILGISTDGSRAFVTAAGPLAPGSTRAPVQAANLFAWGPDGFHYIAQTEPATFETTGPAESVASPNGLYLGFAGFSLFNSEAEPSPNCPDATPAEHCRDVYLYDARSEKLTCVSCAGVDVGSSVLGSLGQIKRLSESDNRAVLDDGEVFFNTPNRLLPRDTNGVGDVYGWRNGGATLISTGTSPDESKFSDASPSGHDVFFRTYQRLVGQDVDSRMDLYDARIGGGIASQNPGPAPEPCEGESCRGPGTSAPPPIAGEVRADSCEAIVARLERAKAKRKALARKAAKASGRRAEKLRRDAVGSRKQVRKLNRKANQCRRQGK